MPDLTLPLGSVLGDVLQLILSSGVFAKLIVLVLATLSVISWALMAHRARVFGRAERVNREFWKRYERTRRGETPMADLGTWCEPRIGLSPLPAIFRYFSQDFWPLYQRKAGGPKEDQLLHTMLRRGVERVRADQLEPLARPLTWLATFSSVAPFLGLLGTVWGIMHSFLQLSQQGSATLDVVGPGIAEALITTVAGLAVAIPAVVGYNGFMRRVDHHDAEIERLASLLSDVVTEEALEDLTATAKVY